MGSHRLVRSLERARYLSVAVGPNPDGCCSPVKDLGRDKGWREWASGSRAEELSHLLLELGLVDHMGAVEKGRRRRERRGPSVRLGRGCGGPLLELDLAEDVMVVEKGWRRASLVEDEAEGQIDLGTRRRGGDLAFGIRSSNQKPQERSSTSVVRDPNHDLKWWSSTTGIWVGGKRVGVSPVDIRKEMVVLLVEVVGVRLRWGVREILGVVERVRYCRTCVCPPPSMRGSIE
ncbi:hypothetical protein CRG98_019068 [Punica granatum]|uniref:Uncharacterized protein n=1 Tax=Punica granatum TaxID=22663 RepID=A0A2I0JWG4_PUNGR|nr:hypothetical protein CRG98_019068 [Punica granatum]